MARLVTLWKEEGPYAHSYAELRHFYDTNMTAEDFNREIQRLKIIKACDLLTIEYTIKRRKAEDPIWIKPDTRPAK